MTEASIREACDAGRFDDATTQAIRLYGDELVRFVAALLRDPVAADDVFAGVCEDLWTGIGNFQWGSTYRTWAYAIARNAVISHLRGERRRPVRLGTSSMESLVGDVRSRTTTALRTETRDKLAEIRATLAPDDQMLLVLRIDRNMAWRDVAAVFEPHGTSADLDRRAAALRKRLERLKTELREKLGR